MVIKNLMLFSLVVFFTEINAQENFTDTLKKQTTATWNGIWDVNDPLCPCHEAQKLADKEYEKLTGEKTPVIQTQIILESSNTVSGSKVKKRSPPLFYKTGKRIKKIFSRKKKKKFVLDDCFIFSKS